MITKIKHFLTLKTLQNGLWLFLDKIVRLGIGLFVSAFVARYLGVDFFGKWNYVIALVAMMSALATLGLDQVVVKHLLEKDEDEQIILGTAFYLRLVGSIFCTLLACCYLFFFKSDYQLLLLALLTTISLWFQSLDVIDLKYQSILQSKKTVIVKNLSFLFIVVFKLFIVYNKYPVIYIVIATMLEVLIGSVGLIFSYGVKKVFRWKFNLKYSKILFRQCWPLIFSGIIIMLYMRLDQVMIGEMLGDKYVGYYSISTRFTELWYFIPSVFVTSVYPNLIEKKKNGGKDYEIACLKLLKVLFLLSFTIAVFFTFFSGNLIYYLYGLEYMPAAFTLKVSIWTGVFVFWGMAAGNFLVLENLNRFNFSRSLQGLIINVILNFILIPMYGINGAAVATLISQSYACYFYYFLSKKTRHIFKLQTKSILIFK